MKNKKVLNTILLGFALVLFVGLILEFCGIIGGTLLGTTIVRVCYYVFNIINILAVMVIVILTIFNLFKDNYSAIKICEFFAIVSFLMSFLTLICFSTNATSLASFGYILIAILSFAMAMFSQIYRLCSIFKTFKNDIETTFGINKKEQTVLPNLKKGDKKSATVQKSEIVEGEIINK